ncbi:MAG: hypothetical protein ACRDCW_11260 [Sarcina sp.]
MINRKDKFVFVDGIIFGVLMVASVEEMIKAYEDAKLVNRHGNITLSMYEYRYKGTNDINKV